MDLRIESELTYPFLVSLLLAFFKEEDEAEDGVDDEEQASALFTMLAIFFLSVLFSLPHRSQTAAVLLAGERRNCWEAERQTSLV